MKQKPIHTLRASHRGMMKNPSFNRSHRLPHFIAALLIAGSLSGAVEKPNAPLILADDCTYRETLTMNSPAA